jgi:lantibiotic modifying enzyme
MAERLGLYTGDLGTLLLLATADRENGTNRSFPLLGKFKARVSSLEGSSLDTIGIGHGTGSLIYGTLLLAQLTRDQEWLEQSARLAATLSADAIRYHAEPDLLSGQAGLLLALTRLAEVTESKEFLSKAQLCVLALGHRFSPKEGWKRPNGDSSLGFAHGSAGVAFAAASFAKLSGNEAAIRLTRTALEFDRKFFSLTDHNWPVLTKAESPWMVAWCNGRPGILLARLAANQILDDSRLAEEIDTCLEHFNVPAHLDFWCCGRSGASEILRDCGQALHKQEYVTAAKQMVDEILERAYRTCFFRFGIDFAENYCFQPSLFRGLAGIAYSALRSIAPGKYPSLVAFDLAR